MDTATSPMKPWHTPQTTDSSTSPVKDLIYTIKSYCHKQNTDSPLTQDEKRVAHFLVKKILAQSENKDILKIKTGGQPLVF